MNWQPIETAPKDGTRVLLWSRFDQDVELAYWSTRIYATNALTGVSSSGGNWICYDHGTGTPALNPTHWMPLPEPPKEAAK